ncbi:nicotinate-nucleotide adenylyltransferase [Marinobacterium lutimaris]|uniref:Probable nicotinate-nucleotide adenylyltransferase n=1 Tax=Marinobacterium lutimaris TaxID=568106 RepID=A0A1H6CUB9_9GAMM|nr:nicotinate-nucleotide adenylyltransferase [Marinobacterium lutimaris]SEG76620.1 nicotinate-nucleotide adenylyltransferase [Marinobacterium lutimaris]
MAGAETGGVPFVFMGGTFDPIHNGHLRTALEIQQWLEIPEVCLIPSKVPVHRDEPGCTSEQRLAMVELAVADEPSLTADAREIRSDKPSYSLLTLESLRQELGPQRPLCMVMGADAYMTLSRWYQWERFIDLCHILVVTRPGYELDLDPEMKRFTDRHAAGSKQELLSLPAGKVLIHELTPLGISATQVRQLAAQGQSPRYLIPDSVWDYIQTNRLYGFNRL